MDWQLHPAFGPLLVSAGVAITVAVSALRWRRIPGATALAGLMVGAAVWCAAYGIELSSTQLARQVFWAKVQYLGIQSVPTLWLLFTAGYAGVPLARHRLAPLLLVQPLAVLLLVWTNEYHWLIWARVETVTRGGLSVLEHVNGPLYLSNVAYAYAMLLVGWALVARYYRHTWGIYRRQALLILGGSLFPWAGNGLYVAGVAPLGYLDLTPFAFAMTGAVASWGLVYYRLLDIVPVARDVVLDRLEDPVIVVDDQDRVVDLNAAARMLVDPRDYAGPRIIGRPASQVLRDVPEILELLRAPEAQPAACAVHADGRLREFEVHLVEVPGRWGGVSVRIVIAHDISGTKRAERELLMSRDRAEAASRAKSTFLANVSHEFRTPLSLILGHGEMLRESIDARERPQEAVHAERVLEAGRHLLGMIEEVLELSMIEAGRMDFRAEPFDVDHVVAELRREVEPAAARSGNRLVVDTIGRLGAASTDARRVKEVLRRLLDNAARFTQNGTITLVAWRHTAADGDWLTFRVLDTGIGIDASRLDTLFMPFSGSGPRPHQAQAGAGLGLALCRRLSQLLGGEISAASTPGVGSEFTFRVPAAARRKSGSTE
jgi:PAS domain S-box-containing protein